MSIIHDDECLIFFINPFSHWKDANPGIPEVEDAKERLAGLKGE